MRTTSPAVRLAAGLALAAAYSPAGAWGPLGHRIVAETAALLVAQDRPGAWGPLFEHHRFELGLYAFLPDALFRHVDGASGAIEAPTHYLNLDQLPGGAAGLPRDRAEARRLLEPKIGVLGLKRAGSVPWRAAQFLELARQELAELRAPRGGYQRGGTAKGDAHRLYLGLYDLGVAAHYSGDAAMPYHATSDWNGFATGEGGIHFFFETDCVDVFEPGLAQDVLAEALRNRARWLTDLGGGIEPPAGLVIRLLSDSASSLPKLRALDKRSAVTKLAAAGTREDASRKTAAQGCRALRPLLVERLAKGAAVTARLWEGVLPEAADLSGAAGLRFSDMELSPAYVPPDDGTSEVPGPP